MYNKYLNLGALLLSVFSFCINSASCDTDKLSDPTEDMISKSVLSHGDTARLKNVMIRAMKGKKIVIGTIGGSITEGAGASAPEYRWSNRAAKWWIDRFPKTKVEFINAGIGATGSNIGAHRINNDLLVFKPDVVIVEFAVNDANNPLASETMEGLTRQILKLSNKPAVIYIFTTRPDGGNAQEFHSKIGYHYKLPMISYRNAIFSEFQSGNIKWEDVMPDGIHPNDQGHKYMAEMIGAYLDGIYSEVKQKALTKYVRPMPKPLTNDLFEFTNVLSNDTLVPISNNGWKKVKAWRGMDAWESETPGSTIEFEVTGDTISMTYYKIKKDMGIVEARIDDLPPMKLTGWFNADWGGYSDWSILGRDLSPGKHKLQIKLLDEKSEGSTGNRFQILSIMESGIK